MYFASKVLWLQFIVVRPNGRGHDDDQETEREWAESTGSHGIPWQVFHATFIPKYLALYCISIAYDVTSYSFRSYLHGF